MPETAQRHETTENTAQRLLKDANNNKDIGKELSDMQRQDPQHYNDVVKTMRREQSELPAEFQHTLTVIGDEKNLKVIQTAHDPSKGNIESFEKNAHKRAEDLIQAAKRGEEIEVKAMGGSKQEQEIIAEHVLNYKKAHPNELGLVDVGGLKEGVPFVVQGTYIEDLGMKHSQGNLANRKQAIEERIHKHLHPEEQAQRMEDLAAKALGGDETAKKALASEGQDLKRETEAYRRKVIEQIGVDGDQHDFRNPVPHAEIKRDADGDILEIEFSKNFGLPVIGARESVDVTTPEQELQDKKQQLDREIQTKTDGWNGRNGSKGMEDSIYKWIDDHDGPSSAEARRRELGQ